MSECRRPPAKPDRSYGSDIVGADDDDVLGGGVDEREADASEEVE